LSNKKFREAKFFITLRNLVHTGKSIIAIFRTTQLLAYWDPADILDTASQAQETRQFFKKSFFGRAAWDLKQFSGEKAPRRGRS